MGTDNSHTAPRRARGLVGSGILIGNLFGIPVRVDWSWIIIFLLVTLNISTAFRQYFPTWTGGQHWMAGVIVSLLFFASILLHELGHSLMARRFGIEVASITLFIFGGVAAIRREPRRPREEFWIAIAGPAVSIVLGLIFLGIQLLIAGVMGPSLLLGSGGPLVKAASNLPPLLGLLFAASTWLAAINFMLVLFNMIPGFPLDGGRVLRSILWAITKNFDRATSIAARCGQFFAIAFALWGIYDVFVGKDLYGLWLVLIGVFLFNAARSSLAGAGLRNALESARARDVLDTSTPFVSPAMSVQGLVDEYVLRQGRHRVLIYDGRQLRGLITLSDIKDIPREEWEMTSLQAAMVSCEHLITAGPDESLEEVVERMNENGFNQLPVVQGGVYYGMVTREAIMHLLQSRSAFRH